MSFSAAPRLSTWAGYRRRLRFGSFHTVLTASAPDGVDSVHQLIKERQWHKLFAEEPAPKGGNAWFNRAPGDASPICLDLSAA